MLDDSRSEAKDPRGSGNSALSGSSDSNSKGRGSRPKPRRSDYSISKSSRRGQPERGASATKRRVGRNENFSRQQPHSSEDTNTQQVFNQVRNGQMNGMPQRNAQGFAGAQQNVTEMLNTQMNYMQPSAQKNVNVAEMVNAQMNGTAQSGMQQGGESLGNEGPLPSVSQNAKARSPMPTITKSRAYVYATNPMATFMALREAARVSRGPGIPVPGLAKREEGKPLSTLQISEEVDSPRGRCGCFSRVGACCVSFWMEQPYARIDKALGFDPFQRLQYKILITVAGLVALTSILGFVLIDGWLNFLGVGHAFVPILPLFGTLPNPSLYSLYTGLSISGVLGSMVNGFVVTDGGEVEVFFSNALVLSLLFMLLYTLGLLDSDVLRFLKTLCGSKRVPTQNGPAQPPTGAGLLVNRPVSEYV